MSRGIGGLGGGGGVKDLVLKFKVKFCPKGISCCSGVCVAAGTFGGD